ncbi:MULTISPECIES: lipopolysaccharide biosynthesis protein [unclassified Streptomyces]|uniref:lipopolysaccharide biosynthesis protein n=1 Tax=unclassified Streptomyces TaxID=2593676 RepID=UPI002DD8F9B9|nr:MULTISPECIES: lipopolysaccharide biosynthesis protein [unclassified Streptomyces]WSF88814.1 lipopolysaccharide biosynthesis protein [Streptomyces sp. NBC_01744]WSC35014.1 lipopolysaccharide biosynthesis protein [Streptomyces sp. NBC_01763]WSC43376.1 lipopolysaccharide biosynthesis protein [Streptomyces sp. NBC_01762]WSC57711.1 lipopolysaccharide biosynthesis protein [Streptomyces sp. NBC_01761]WSD22913.1 lipopolysaccharide biosynthesis protein [Streptomyces sp. NBC_01751]
MTHPIRALEDQDEPALLRDQFRQLLRYRALLASGVVVGLLGGGWLALSGEASYTATGEVFVRSATSDPFATGASADKGINIGSERQTAVSDAVGTIAARSLAERDDRVEVGKLLSGLQVTNPPNTLVLRFSYTGRTPALAKRRAEALADAYLQIRKERTENSIDNMVAGYRAQLKPLTEQRDKLAESAGASGDDVTSARANLVVAISELSRKISELRALDTTPGYLNKKPVAPEKPTGAGLPLLLGLGGVVGLALGLLLSWVRLVFDPAVRSTRELVRSLGAPLLGTLPRERGSAGTLLAIGRSGSRLAEEYRAVAFRLAYDPSFEQRRRLLVTAPRGDNSAAAAAAVNLAAAFAEMGRDVLLVEADLRTPALARDLGSAVQGRPRWAAEGDDRTWPSDSRTNVDVPGSGAFTLIAGRRVDNVPRALTSAPVSRIVAEADRPGAVVIVLAPPVLSYADAVALIDRVEGVVVVCDPREVHRSDLERIREIIGAAGGSVLGTLLHPGQGRIERRSRKKSSRRRNGGGRPGTDGQDGRGRPDGPEHTGDPTETLGLRTFDTPAARR